MVLFGRATERETLAGLLARAVEGFSEASVRCGDHQTAATALATLPDRALASGTDHALGLLARSRALLAEGAEGEHLYQEAIACLTRCRVRTALARTHLVYGEWLRRQRRRRDARAQLRTAHDMLAAMGAHGFAERARIELNATGEHVRQRTAGAAYVLTPQEAQVAFPARKVTARPPSSPGTRATADGHACVPSAGSCCRRRSRSTGLAVFPTAFLGSVSSMYTSRGTL
jgi:hypothetical protein